jgi:hypothetical protein
VATEEVEEAGMGLKKDGCQHWLDERRRVGNQKGDAK